MTIKDREKTYQVLGIDISAYSTDEFFALIENRLAMNNADSPPAFIVTVNPEIVIQSIVDNDFKNILLKSTVNTADGIGIRWAVNFLYGKEVDRITGSDSVKRICEISAGHQRSVFLYGAMPTVAERAADILKKELPDLTVSGTFSPGRATTPFRSLPPETQTELRSAEVIFVALGAPDQEKWIYENKDELPLCKLIIGVGGSFDFIAGNVKRAPEWMCKSGLEWLFRLYLQPSRWKRMIRLPLFALNVILLKSSSTKIQSTQKT